MKKLMTGIMIGAVVGGIVGTVAGNDICDIKDLVIKKGKKIAKKYHWM